MFRSPRKVGDVTDGTMLVRVTEPLAPRYRPIRTNHVRVYIYIYIREANNGSFTRSCTASSCVLLLLGEDRVGMLVNGSELHVSQTWFLV